MKIINHVVEQQLLVPAEMEIGDVVMFPKTEGWQKYVFMRIWDLNTETIRLARLDGKAHEVGQTYSISPDMAEGKFGKKYKFVLYDAELTIKETVL